MTSHRQHGLGRALPALGLLCAIVLVGCQGALTATPPLPRLAEDTLATPQQPGALRFPDTDGAPVEEVAIDATLLEAQEVVNQWSLEQKVASLFLVHVPGAALADYEQLVEDYPVAGFLILRDNLSRDPQQAKDFLLTLKSLSDLDLLVAVDQEGGAVERLGGDDFPSAPELGEEDPAETTMVTRERNLLVRDSGANLNFGIVADVSPGSDAYIHRRSFGEDSTLVAKRVSAAFLGQVEGVALAVKHFPGHGLTDLDTHRHLAITDVPIEQWRTTHLPPFEAAIEQGAPIVMLSHIVVTQMDSVPTSLSKNWVDLLRGELGFSGVIATDDLSMLEKTGESSYGEFSANAMAAFQAGVDLVVDAGAGDSGSVDERLGEVVGAVVEGVKSGAIDEAQIEAAAVRVVSLRLSLR